MAKLVEIEFDDRQIAIKHTYEAKDGTRFTGTMAAVVEAAADSHDTIQGSTLGQYMRKRREERQGAINLLDRAQELVDQIVANMVAKGYPVEATNKAGHTETHIPCSQVSPWSGMGMNGNSWFEENLARVLIGGWHSKAALIQLMIEIRKVRA